MLPRLNTRFDLYGWYDQVRASGKPVAWCSAFAPAEALLAAGVIPVYPENHAAMLGALSPERDMQRPWSRSAIEVAEAAGFSGPKLCSYAQADIGVLLGASSPIGSLPAPDAFYACDSQCAVVARWGEAVRQIVGRSGRECPHYVLHAPPLRGEHHSEAELTGFSDQLREHIQDICRRFGTTYSKERLQSVVAESAAANALWQQCLELAKQRPSPWSMTDAFQAMAPIVVARGDASCTRFYQDLLAELQHRIDHNIRAIPDENIRLCWDAIPIWPRKNWLARFCAERGALFSTSTYTHSWWFEFDLAKPWDSLIERYAWNTMNRSGRWVLDWTLGLVEGYRCDGIVCHWNDSCGIWNSYVKRRLSGYEQAGIPVCLIKADMVDARCFDEDAVSTLLGDFLDRIQRETLVP
jgi:benzoyl-CoA reductase/2-hydroxyglutaryl-CoA dehydratase subunit BcrC/BadD/HgdB